MKEPNFFILGAPKCGTTALATYLSEHPEVFMTAPKEPHHYNTDHQHGSYKDRDAYLSLFAQARDDHKAVGEASVWYLYSRDAVQNILRDYPCAKFIVMLRNPVEMAPSLYRQQVFTGHETAKTFEKAWYLQEARRKGSRIPTFCTDPSHLLYKEACSLGSQYERLLTQVGKSEIFTILHDDLKSYPEKVWSDALEFLNLTHDGRNNFPSINSAKARKSKLIKRVHDVSRRVGRNIGANGSLKIVAKKPLAFLDNWNRREVSSKMVDDGTKERLKSEFRDDIILLSDLLNRNLLHWLDG